MKNRKLLQSLIDTSPPLTARGVNSKHLGQRQGKKALILTLAGMLLFFPMFIP